jgi:hypothetical protein
MSQRKTYAKEDFGEVDISENEDINETSDGLNK